MLDVVLCIAVDHDPWLLALAVGICIIGAFSIVQMSQRARTSTGLQRIAWLFLTAVASGATIWCTHFVAMLAYEAKAPVVLDPVLTIASLIIAVVGTSIGIAVAIISRTAWLQGVGGALFGLAIAGMHFTGMRAYRVQGVVEWHEGFVIAAIVCACVLGAAAMIALGRREAKLRLTLGTGLIVAAIASLHFTAMTALTITPLDLGHAALDAVGTRALGLATGLIGLVVIIAGVFAALIDRETRGDAMRKLQFMAMNDLLTQLPNRTAFKEMLEQRVAKSKVDGSAVGLCMIDLVRFKEVNDLHGHQAGDELLVQVAERLRAAILPGEFVARLGGDEFAALTSFGDREALIEFVDRIQAGLLAPHELGAVGTSVGASIGVASYPHDAARSGTLINNADLAMYRAKREGSLAPCYYAAELDEAVRARRELAGDLKSAIENGELEVHYQLQADVRTRAVTGYEALVRWRHHKRGPIPPDQFIPVAEQNGLILALGEFVLRRACRDAAAWPHKSRVAVNVSALQLAHADLPQLFHEVLLESGLPPSRLEIELTETAIIANRDRALHVLRQIKALGVAVALDDFGTGYSSLETLRAFAFDKIKLDRYFVQELEDSPQATAIVRAVLALGKSLSIPVLAEGIETEEQMQVLIREGCDQVQGFLLGRPEPNRITLPPAETRRAA